MPHFLLRGALALALVAVAACGDAATSTTAPPQTTVTVAPTTTSTAPTTTAPATTTTVAATTTAPPATTTTVPPTTSAPTTTTTLPDGVVAIDVEVTAGQVDVEDRVAVGLDDEVTLTVTADVSDEVHVHGYDLFGDVAPGTPVVIEFVADIPGIFEVELEDSRLLLFELVVEP